MNVEANNSTALLPDEDTAVRPTVLAKAASRSRASKIRSELNIEKWPAIWQPAKSKNKPAVRILERELNTADGSRVVSRVEVGYTQLGTLTTEEQKMLYVLIKLWEDSGKPDRQVFFSSRGLARLLKKKGWGTNVIQAITKSLRKLRTVPIEWINSYFDRTKIGATVVDRRPFTLLGDLRIVERHQDGAVNSSLGYFKFDDHVLNNLQLNYTKPVCIEEFFKLRSEIAQLIYSHIDLMLFDKNRYERRSRELFDDLGLKNAEYDHMYERRRAIERALRELVGLRLSSGVLKTGTLDKTADGKDYKVAFVKGQAATSEARLGSSLAESPETIVINNYSQPKDELVAQAEQVVKFFHKAVHNVDKHEPQSKEVNQALSLVSQYGFDQTKYIIEYAASKAVETNWKIQHFGAVITYASRALSELSRKAQQSVVQKPVETRPASGFERWARGKRRLECLSDDDRSRRLAKLKSELLQKQPFLIRHAERGSQAVEEIVRGWLIRQLENEPMDLLVFDSGLLLAFPWYTATQNLAQ